MKKNMLTIVAAALALCVQGAAAAESEIVYALGDSTLTYGTGKNTAETYDVALRIDNPALVGAKVKAVRIAFPFTENLSNAKAWLSKDLPAIKSTKAQEPDVAQKAFDVAKGYTEVTFDEPYTLTAEGLYVGYSFDVDKVATAVSPVVTTGNTSPDGFYVHTTKLYRTAWRSLYGAAGQLALQVVLAGEQFQANAVTPTVSGDLNVLTGQANPFSFYIENHGLAGVKSIDYEVAVDGKTVTGHADVTLKNIYGAFTLLQAEAPAISVKGKYPFTLTVTKVNGQPNADAEASSAVSLLAYNTLPKHRAVLEEYTGTWCGYCPRGFVGLEEMNRLYPDDFIGISYHNGDAMEVTTQYPSVVTGFPAAWLDRYRETDAFCGDAEYGLFGIDKAWLARNEVLAPAEVSVAPVWANDSVLGASASVTFPFDEDEQAYELSFVLVADGLTGTGSGWTQSNYYSGAQGWPSSMDAFTQGGSSMTGLVFNDVFVAWSGAAGIAGSLTAPITGDVPQQYTYQFNLNQVLNTSGNAVIQDKNKLRVVALLIEKATGIIVNAAKADAGQAPVSEAIGSVARQGTAGLAEYYDLQGRKVEAPVRGLYIKRQQQADGRVHTVKVQL